MTDSNFPSSPASRFLWFGWFLALGSGLTWLPIGGFFQFGLALAGFGLPLFYAWRKTDSGAPPLWKKDVLSPLPPWALLLLIAIALGLRLAAIQTLPAWPNSDEGGIGTIGLRISQHWTSRFFYAFAQTPPLAFWMNALAAKSGFNPFLALWLPPAVISVLTLGVGYFAARRLFNPTLALLFTFLLAFSYWPLYIGRHCHEGITIPLLMFLAFWFLAGILHGPVYKGDALRIFLFGLISGLGFFTFTSWAMLALLTSLYALGRLLFSKGTWKRWLWFFLGMAWGALPFFRSVIKEGYGHHLSSLTPWSGWFPWAHQEQVDWHYLTVLFWGAFDPEAAYTPVEGGFLNPLLGAVFFLGLAEIIRHRKESWAGWVLFSFPILLLPGLLSMNVEAFRVIQVLPLLLFTTALGLQYLLEGLSLQRRGPYLVLGLLVSLVFDFYRLAGPWTNCDTSPENFDRPVKSIEKLRAYRVLEQVWKEKGPGWVLTDFDTEAQNDATLALCTVPFDASRHPAQNPGDKPWVGLS